MEEPQNDADVIETLDSLEGDIAAMRLRWWHLLFWLRSPLRQVESRFQVCEGATRNRIAEARKIRESNWETMTKPFNPLLPSILTMSHLGLLDRETAMASRLERVRFLLLSKESEQHARRSVLLGVVGVALGILSLALSLKPIKGWLY